MALALTLLAACGGSPRSPTGLGDRDNQPAVSQIPSRLIGVWRTRALVSASGASQDVTTTWQFKQDRACSLATDTGGNLDGSPNHTERACSYVDRGPTVSITFDDTGETRSLSVDFPNIDLSRLVLDGTEYQRMPGNAG